VKEALKPLSSAFIFSQAAHIKAASTIFLGDLKTFLGT